MIVDKSSLIVSIVPLVIVIRLDDFAVICDRGLEITKHNFFCNIPNTKTANFYHRRDVLDNFVDNRSDFLYYIF